MKRSRAARGAMAILIAACIAGGCASSRWVDEHTAGDLWGTSGTDLGFVKLLGDTPLKRKEWLIDFDDPIIEFALEVLTSS